MLISVIVSSFAFANILEILAYNQHLRSKSVATGFVQKQKILLITRVFMFIIAPALGYFLVSGQTEKILQIAFVANAISLFAMYATFMLLAKRFIIPLNLLKGNRVSDIFVFALHLNAPFIINHVAGEYLKFSAIIIQLSPLLSAATTTYIIYIFDTKIANIIDGKDKHNETLHERLITKVYGRALATLVFGIMVI